MTNTKNELQVRVSVFERTADGLTFAFQIPFTGPEGLDMAAAKAAQYRKVGYVVDTMAW